MLSNGLKIKVHPQMMGYHISSNMRRERGWIAEMGTTARSRDTQGRSSHLLSLTGKRSRLQHPLAHPGGPRTNQLPIGRLQPLKYILFRAAHTSRIIFGFWIQPGQARVPHGSPVSIGHCPIPDKIIRSSGKKKISRVPR